MAVEHYSLAISWRYPSYWTILINWIFISAKLINCYDKWFEGRTCPVGHLAQCFWTFSSQRDDYLSFQLSVFDSQDSVNAVDDGLVFWFDGVIYHALLLQGKVQFTEGFFGLVKSCKRMSPCRMDASGDEGGTLTGSWRRWSLGKLYEEQPESDSHSGPWREREMRKRKREILGFVWSHFTFCVLRKMDGSLDLWSLRPNCSTDHKCHILLYSSGLLSLCLCVRLMKNISKAVLCNERSHSGTSHNPAENEAIICTLSNPRKKTDKSASTSKLMPGIFNACLWAKWFLTCQNGCA